MPLFLAALHLVFHGRYVFFYVAFCLLGALSAALAYFLAREVLPDTAARTAAVLLAVYPPHIYFATDFSSEALFVPLFTFGLWQVLVCLRTHSPVPAALAGLAFGWAALARSFAILLPPLVVAVLLWSCRGALRRALPPLALFLAGFAACLLPWIVRDYRVHGGLVVVATNGGSTFYGANNDWVIGSFRHYGNWVTTRQLVRPGQNLGASELEHDRAQYRLGLAWVRSHLAWMPGLLLGKYVRLWLPDIASGNRAYVLLQVVCTTPFLVLVIAGQIRFLRRDSWSVPWFFLNGAGLTTAATALIFWGNPRFRDANAALLMLYAAPVVQSWLRPFLARPKPRASGASAGV